MPIIITVFLILINSYFGGGYCMYSRGAILTMFDILVIFVGNVKRAAQIHSENKKNIIQAK